MAKMADEYFKLDPWQIIEEGFDSEYNQVSESIFSLGNEYMGIRGYFEEGSTCESLLGSYFNGIYENSHSQYTSYKGVVTEPHFMVNAVDWLHTRIWLDGEKLDTKTVTLTDFKRVLNLTNGVLTREFIWTTQSGKRLKVHFERFLSMEEYQYGYQKITLIPENFSGDIQMEMGLDFNTIHAGRGKAYWNEKKKGFEADGAAIIAQTTSSEQRIFSGFTLKTNQAIDKQLMQQDQFIGFAFSFPLIEGQESTLEKMVTNIVEKKITNKLEDSWQKGQLSMEKQRKLGYDAAKEKQQKFWKAVWENYDIQIEGDAKNQQGIRYCIFQLQQTYHGQDPSNNIGAKGLTGESYGGHAFWDTETCCLPYYLFSNPKAAKNLLEFRYTTLPQAKERARDLDCRGACYPIATLNGKEACDLWQHASTQFQPSTAVAYGIWHYTHVTNDQDFLYDHGIEILIEISRFLEARGDWSPTTGKFGFYGVMGPDEFQVMVNHNGYTNYMAQATFDYTIAVLKELKGNALDQYKQVVERTHLADSEVAEWQRCSQNTMLIQTETGLFEQHEGYFDLPHVDIHRIPIEEFPLYEHWSYDRIYRNDMIKQPDVLMFQFLYNQRFTTEEKRVNYDFYEPRTIHESSLSPAIHSILAAELQKPEEAFDFFGFATRMDLDNYNRNTREGLHTTSIAGAWMNIVYGFGGLRSDGEQLLLNPTMPEQWTSYTFRIEYQGAIMRVQVTKEQVSLAILAGKPVTINLYDEEIVVEVAEQAKIIPEQWRS